MLSKLNLKLERNESFLIFNKLFVPMMEFSSITAHRLNIVFNKKTSYLDIWGFLKISWLVQDFRSQLTTSDLISDIFYQVSGFAANTIIHSERVHETILTDPSFFTDLLTFFKNSSFFQLNTLVDIWGREVLYYKDKQISLVYNIISDVTYTRFVFKVILTKTRLVMPTLVNVYPSANWAERECWDMLGVIFLGHIDLRRILTDYGFLGHPLRKEFPLTGFLEVRYSDVHKRVVFEPVELPQELRFFDFTNPWNFNVVSNKKVDYISSSNSIVDIYDVLSRESLWQTSLTHEQEALSKSFLGKNKSQVLLGMPTSIKNVSLLFSSFFSSDVSKTYFIFNPFLWGDFFPFVHGEKDERFVAFLNEDVENDFFLLYLLVYSFYGKNKKEFNYLTYYDTYTLSILNSSYKNGAIRDQKSLGLMKFLFLMSSSLQGRFVSNQMSKLFVERGVLSPNLIPTNLVVFD